MKAADCLHNEAGRYQETESRIKAIPQPRKWTRLECVAIHGLASSRVQLSYAHERKGVQSITIKGGRKSGAPDRTESDMLRSVNGAPDRT